MKSFLTNVALVLLLTIAGTSAAEARSIVNVEPYAGYVCVITYDDGVRTIDYCPTDWPPAGYQLGVVCQCEHYGSPYDDICEAITSPFVLQATYGWTRVGHATIPVPPSPGSEFARFACPRGVPPNAVNCTIRVRVTTPTGATGSAICRSH